MSSVIVLGGPARLDASDYLLRGYALLSEFTVDSMAAALDCLDHSLAVDPAFAPAMAAAAYCRCGRSTKSNQSAADRRMVEARMKGGFRQGYSAAPHIPLSTVWPTVLASPHIRI
jgi:hypothetical protein